MNRPIINSLLNWQYTIASSKKSITTELKILNLISVKEPCFVRRGYSKMAKGKVRLG